MKNYPKIKLRCLQFTQLMLVAGCFLTFLQLKEYGLIFAALSGYVFADFVETLNLDFGRNINNNDLNK